MKTKFVYVVISDEKDYYLEQTFLSVSSLRLYHPNDFISLVIDERTQNTLKGGRDHILKIVNEVVVIKTLDGFSKAQMSRELKTNLRNLIEGDYLFIDSDTIIAGELNDIDNYPYDIAAVPDQHLPIAQNTMAKSIRKWAKLYGWTYDESIYYFNSGVMYVKDNACTHAFYDVWHEKWKANMHNYNIDQPSLAAADEINHHLICKMDDTWNCQVVENGLKYLASAKIIHYFASGSKSNKESAYLFYNSEIYAKIRKVGCIPPEYQSLLEFPQNAFVSQCRIITGKDLEYMSSSVCAFLSSHVQIHRFLDALLYFFYTLKHKFLLK